MPLDQLAVSAAIAVVIAIGVSLSLEWTRRPHLVVEIGDLRGDSRWSIAHLRVSNVPLADRGRIRRQLGRVLTARPADGCSLSLSIAGDPIERPLDFDGKWSSTRQPIRDGQYDVERLPGIHHITLQPGSEDLVAVAIRPRRKPAYAFWAEHIYAVTPFPEAPGCTLPPGTYRVEAEAKAGELRSKRRNFQLVVAEHDDSICLSAT